MHISPSLPQGSILPVTVDLMHPLIPGKNCPTVVMRRSMESSSAQLVIPAVASVCPNEGSSVNRKVRHSSSYNPGLYEDPPIIPVRREDRSHEPSLYRRSSTENKVGTAVRMVHFSRWMVSRMVFPRRFSGKQAHAPAASAASALAVSEKQ